ncbi:hypothetical protein ACFO4L_08510 [Bacillus daqingensis]|uniref:Uncharacterized protein n=1 Tax=Bacillus daqingensis TaxID=872396 RepID=A0ABV9NX39_9BACI
MEAYERDGYLKQTAQFMMAETGLSEQEAYARIRKSGLIGKLRSEKQLPAHSPREQASLLIHSKEITYNDKEPD